MSESTDSTARLPDIPGGWTTKDFLIAGQSFRLALPAEPDAFLDDPAVRVAHDRDGYMPYWAYLWPASIEMSRAVLAADWHAGAQTLEIGAGIGLVGIVAASRGLDVLITDYDKQAVNLSIHNARLNGLNDVRGTTLDWRTPPQHKYPIILGCDLLYEAGNHEPILNLLDAMLDENGVCWLGDAGRQLSAVFIELAKRRGWNVALRDVEGKSLPEPRVGAFQLLILTRKCDQR